MIIQNDIKKYHKGEKEIPNEITSAPVNSLDEMNEERGEELKNYLKISMTINKTDIDVAIENAESSTREVINEIIDPTPGYIVDEKFSVSSDLSRFNENETNFKLTKNLQKRLDDILSIPSNSNFTLDASVNDLERLPNKSDENL